MKVIDCSSYKIVIFDVASDLTSFLDEGHDDNKLIYVSLDGTDTTLLSPDRFLVKNRNSSFLNHMMWEGLLDEDEQDEYIMNRCEKFFNDGKQMLIEDYDFIEDEPFYDYSR
jgi:hypothetical protein